MRAPRGGREPEARAGGGAAAAAGVRRGLRQPRAERQGPAEGRWGRRRGSLKEALLRGLGARGFLSGVVLRLPCFRRRV